MAVVGAGGMGVNHLRVVHDFDENVAQLVGVAETDPQRLGAAVRRFHVEGFADHRLMIERVRPHLVAVVVPTRLHAAIASDALELGANVLVEKPIASTVEEAASLARLAGERGLVIAVGHVERFNPAVVALKGLMASGGLGSVYCLHSRRLGPSSPRNRDVGVALDLATHDLDAMRHLVGAEVDRAYAETRQCIGQQHEDLLFGIVHFRTGVVGVVDVNRLTPTKVRELTVTGERGMYLVNYLTQELYFYENDYSPLAWEGLRSQMGVSEGTMTRLKVERREPLHVEYEDVLEALQVGRPPTVTAADGAAVLQLAHRLISSTQEGEVVACGT